MRGIWGIGVLLVASAAMAVEKSPLDEKVASAGKDAAEQLAIGDLYIEAAQIKKAKQAYKQAKWKDAANPEAQLGLIRAQIAEKNFRSAKAACRKLERAHQKMSAGFVCSGWFWLANQRPSRAAEEFQKALALGDVVRGKTGIGEAARLEFKWDEAMAAYKEAIGAGAGYLAHMGLGLALEGKGDKAGALAELKKAFDSEPASCLAAYHYGRLLETGDGAETALKTALAIRPGWFEALMDLGKAYDNARKFDKSAEIYKTATEVDDKRAEGFMGLGQALYKLGSLDEALAALTKLSELVPNNVDAYLLIAEIQFAKNNPDAAIEAMDRARGVASSDVSVFIRSAEIYVKANRLTNARAYLSQALSMKPKMSKAHAMLGEIACSRKLYDEGQEHYANALKGDLEGVSKKDLEKKRAACKK